jgi:hypothetical protein
MRYLLMIHADEKRVANMAMPEIKQVLTDCGKMTEKLQQAGAFLASARLRPTSTATTVRAQNGNTLITDGPFAEAKEALGGFYLIEAKDLDEALAWTAKMPHIHFGCIEVRPVWEAEDWEPNR